MTTTLTTTSTQTAIPSGTAKLLTLQPGIQVQVFDPEEPPCEWTTFIVTAVEEDKVRLRCPLGVKTWAWLDEILVTDAQKGLS